MSQPDVEAMATEVVLIVKTALGPVLERLAAVEARQAVLGDVRDRLVTVETKAALPPPVLPEPEPAVDLSPVLERLAAAEARVSVLGDLRDRVVVVETKQAIPVLPLPPETGIDDLRERIVNLETKSAGPSLSDMGVAELRTHLATVQAKVFEVSERVAVVETRPQLPGPAGEPGLPGKDGEPGKDGTAGLTYVGVYQDGKTYDLGELTTFGGSLWHANERTTTKPGDGSKGWTLACKRGRDGRDGKDGAQGAAGRDLTKEPPAWRS